MRTTTGLLLAGVMVGLVCGCSTSRLGLAKSDPPRNQPKPEERVKYGFPWSKDQENSKAAVAKNESGESGIPSDLAAKLAESRKSSERKPPVTEALRRAGEAEARGDLDSARAAYLQVVEADATNAEAHHRLGVIADMQKDPVTADSHYSRAYAANRKDADLLSDMGYSLLLRGRLEDSERRLKEALEINPYHRSALTNLGLVYGKQGKYDASLAMFRQSGTESEAQKNIAALFPNGRPTESNSLALASKSPAETMPLPITSTSAGKAAPPMPADIDRRFATSTIDLKPSLQPGPANMPPTDAWPNGNPLANAAPGDRQPANTAVPSVPDSTWVLQNSRSPLVPNNQGPMPPAATPASSPMAARSNDSSPFWRGNLPEGTTAESSPSSNPTNGWNWGQAGTVATNNNATNRGNIEPARYEPSRYPLSPNSQEIQAPIPLAGPEATRWAAQMAMNAGPGSLFPVMTAGATDAGNPNGGSRVEWAYGQVPGDASTGTPGNNVPANRGFGWATEAAPNATPIQPAIYQNGQRPNPATNGLPIIAPGNNGSASTAPMTLAPPSPWNDWQTPASASPWTDSTPPAAVNPGPANMTPANSYSLPNDRPIPPVGWPAATENSAATTTAPTSTTSDGWPSANTPGNGNVPANVSRGGVPAPRRNAFPANGGASAFPQDPVTVPNWPYGR